MSEFRPSAPIKRADPMAWFILFAFIASTALSLFVTSASAARPRDPELPITSIGDGVWAVGTMVPAGRWHLDGLSTPSRCTWWTTPVGSTRIIVRPDSQIVDEPPQTIRLYADTELHLFGCGVATYRGEKRSGR